MIFNQAVKKCSFGHFGKNLKTDELELLKMG